MPTFGRFQTVDELASSGPFAVFSAREGSGEPVFAIKTFRTLDELADPEVVARRAAAFLAAAGQQRKLGDAGAEHWAKIHDLGKTEEFAYYVTDLAPLTAQRLVESRRDLDARSLVAIVSGANQGLIELRDATGGGDLGRAHGELKPSNILLDANPGSGVVLLCDPLSEDRLDREARLGDIKGLGGLLFQLVCHRPPPAANEVRKGPEWDRMGQQGEGLRLLCEQLLNPTAAGTALTPEEINKRCAAVLLLRARRTGMPLPAKLAIAVVVLGALGGGAWFLLNPAPPPAPPPPKLVDEKDPREVEDAVVKAQLAAIEKTLSDARAELDTFGEAGSRAYTQLSRDFNALANEITENRRQDWRSLPTDATEVPADLATHREPIKTAYAALKARLDALPATIAATRGGLKLARLAAEADAGVETVGTSLEAGQKRVTNLSAEAQQEYTKLRERWTAIRTELDAAAKSAEAFAGEGEEALSQQITKIAGDATTLDAERKSWKEKYDKAGKVLEDRITADRDNFKKAESGINSDDLFYAVKKRFFPEAAAYADTGDASEDGYVQLKKKAMDAALKVEELLAPPKPGFTPKADSFVTADQLNAAYRALANRAVDRVSVDDLFMGGSANFDPASDKAVAAEKAALAGWSASLGTLLTNAGRVEAMLDDGFGWTEPGEAGATIERLRAAVNDSPALKALDDEGRQVRQFGTRERPLDGNEHFSAAAEAVRSVVARADALAAVNSINAPADLLRLIDAEGADPKSVARVLAAWKKLAASTYPGTVAELDAASTNLNGKVIPAAARITDPARRKSASDTATAVIPAMWLALVNQRLGTTSSEVKAAFDPAKMRGWGIETDSPPGLAPAAAYNLQRVRLLESVRGITGTDDQVKAAIMAETGAFLAKADSLPDLTSRRSVSEMVSPELKLKNYRDGKFLYLPSEGPGSRPGTGKWIAGDADIRNESEGVTFTSPSGKERIEFRRVNTGSEDVKNYLSTTEVSVGVFLEILSGAGQKPTRTNKTLEDGRLIMRDYTLDRNCRRDSTNDVLRTGPRCWDWIGCEIGPSTPEPETGNGTLGWIANRASIRGLSPAYVGGVPAAPSDASPMNYIPPAGAAYVAALAGCRLPTTTEWAAANERGANVNRRDQTWVDQANHIASLFPGQIEKIVLDVASPYAGIFLTDDDAKKPADVSPAVSGNDGTLWFAPVAEGGGTVFHHIVGNVAEFVFDDSAQLGGLTKMGAMPEPKAYTDLARRDAAKFKVIGASALSPAAYAPEQPQGVRRFGAEGYSDVGFRLAFTATGVGGGGNLAGQVVKDLEGMPYLSPTP